ncbi:hypothetical protein PSN13_01104 [Micromonospora saelicesensis]|uniref:Uncharacterized protein n=1 Tax=Micromonospora saelicesensis TaxID=285676 RepID=A0A328NXQ2_9ACTN|nr:hypothetical protein PSN13_01104 [Micromonospora saelicesensis]
MLGPDQTGLQVRIEIDVCDVCRNPSSQVKTYTVSVGDRTGITDRCAAHSEELEAILTRNVPYSEELEALLSPDERPFGRRRGGRGMQVVDMDEVEKAKGRQ